MASLVSKIKDRVHRRSGSTDSATASNREEAAEPRTTEAVVPNSPTADGHRSKPRMSVENSAFHVTSTGGVRKSLEAPQDPYQTTYANRNASNHNSRFVTLGNHESAPGHHATEADRARHGMLPMSGNTHTKNISREEQQAMVSDIVPGRESSKNAVIGSPGPHDGSNVQGRSFVPPRKPLNNGSASDHRRQSGVGTTQQYRISHEAPRQQHPESVSTIRAVNGAESNGRLSTSTSAGLAHPAYRDSLPPNDSFNQSTNRNSHGIASQREQNSIAKPLPQLPSSKQNSSGHLVSDAQLAEQYLSTSRDLQMAETQKARALDSGHLVLPRGFNLQNTEETHVYEEQRPAVVNETVIKERTQIVREAITRDIHVHHYYTYLQPIRVVEVLPARHFYLDLETGVKTEVLPPDNWQMPANMAPVSPDTSMLKATMRHYVVDEEHPYGMLESDPLDAGHRVLRPQMLA